MLKLFLLILLLKTAGGSNEYPQCMSLPTCTFFGSKIRKLGIPLKTPIYHVKVGFKGVFIARTCFPDDIYIFAWPVESVDLWLEAP